MASVFDVAQYINYQFGKLSKIKLQKLLYFCQAWHLGKFKKTLFDADFYAWEKGPVVVELHNSMHHSDKVVPNFIANANIDNLSDNDKIYIDSILDIYGDMDKDELVELTYNDICWKSSKKDELISKNSIQNCYENKVWLIQ